MENNSESKIEQDYQLIIPLLDRLVIEAEDCLNAMFSKSEIKIHTILHRIKTVKSCKEKLLRKKDDSGNIAPVHMLTDLVGLRIVCLFLSDIAEIENMIDKSFRVIHKDDKTNSSDSNSFGYHGTHFIVMLKEEYSGPRYDLIKNIAFEIQVRTITMDAWAAASHYLDYKSGKGVPSELKKDFYALSGLFYIVDTHFELFFRESQNSKNNTSLTPLDILLEKELNEDTFNLYLRNKFPNRIISTSDHVSELAIDLIDAGYKTIREVDNDFIKGKGDIEKNAGFTSAALIRRSLCSVNSNYKRIWENRANKALERLNEKFEFPEELKANIERNTFLLKKIMKNK